MAVKTRIHRDPPKEPGKTGRIKSVDVVRVRSDGTRDHVATTKTLRAAENVRKVFAGK